MVYKNEAELINGNILAIEGENITIKNVRTFQDKVIDNMVDTIVVGDSAYLKKICYWVAYSCGIQLGVIPASIQELYSAMGRGEVKGFCVPAINIRTLTFDSARAVFRAAKKIKAGAFIFEIAKSEIGYTNQRPQEYTSIIILAAMRENYRGSVFIQGDHFQVNAKNYRNDKEKEISQLKNVIKEAIEANFYNIDIDSSTLVDLSKPTLDEQQRLNYEVCSFFTDYIRRLQPKDIEISIGGEIGEVGGKNSTSKELHAFMRGYRDSIRALKGISKISIQTGTSHGGVVLPDGSMAKVNIDFATLKDLSEISRKDYSMAGAVQHGASTLPNEAFHHFREAGCAEVHLATQFQNMTYDYLPLRLKEKIYAWLHQECSGEKKEGWTNDQFIYKVRKKALGPFKKEIHSLATEAKNKISGVLEEEFSFLFEQLNIKDTKAVVEEHIKRVVIEKTKDDFIKEDRDLGVLEGAD